TGSTISTMTKETANELKLQQFVTPVATISYGNKSTQYTSRKALLKFTFNDETEAQVYIYVVDKQNEDIILGMDWLEKDDIIIHAKEKKISKAIHTASNSTELAIDGILQKYPRLTSEDSEQNLTTAPYTHSIDTGDAKPMVTRDFRRSAAENDAIAKEVESMLKKNVIRPSNSDWCSPVILIKKPDGSFRFCIF
ncbi:hypothetical protein, partial, partial [Parasitella parasitica]